MQAGLSAGRLVHLTCARLKRFALRLRSSRNPEAQFPGRLTNDLDASLEDMELIVRISRGEPALVARRLKGIGIEFEDLARTNPELLIQMTQACRLCPIWRRCARSASASDLDAVCLNSAAFATIARTRS